MIRVMSLPDWRAGNNYQGMLGAALAAEGCEVIYPIGYRRLLPLSRTDFNGAQVLHLHWPEYYFKSRDHWNFFRDHRFPLDVWLATRRQPLVYTAHNFLPHNRAATAQTFRNYRAVLRCASAVIAHSARAARHLAEFLPAAANKIQVVAHGDLAEDFPSLPDAAAARQTIGLPPDEPMALVFGRVERYKGLETLVAAWPRLHPTARLWIAGTPESRAYADSLRALAASSARVTLELQWMPPADLAARMAAANITLFNYVRSFTSGAGCLARSLGKTIVLPAQLDTIDLMEPAPTVFRFEAIDGDLPAVLARAFAAPPDPAGTAAWRRATSWRVIAQQVAAVYRQVLR